MAAQPNVRAIEPEQQGDSYRSPPHNLEAEQALLGAILVNNEACDRVSSFLDPSHFFEAVHARIYEAASTLARQWRNLLLFTANPIPIAPNNCIGTHWP